MQVYKVFYFHWVFFFDLKSKNRSIYFECFVLIGKNFFIGFLKKPLSSKKEKKIRKKIFQIKSTTKKKKRKKMSASDNQGIPVSQILSTPPKPSRKSNYTPPPAPRKKFIVQRLFDVSPHIARELFPLPPTEKSMCSC